MLILLDQLCCIVYASITFFISSGQVKTQVMLRFLPSRYRPENVIVYTIEKMTTLRKLYKIFSASKIQKLSEFKYQFMVGTSNILSFFPDGKIQIKWF